MVAGELSHWQTMAKNLGMGSEEITDIENNGRGEAERRKSFLRKWIERDGSAATYEKLCEVLKILNQPGAAERISDIPQRNDDAHSHDLVSDDETQMMSMLDT